jgi:hypothetical protein
LVLMAKLDSLRDGPCSIDHLAHLAEIPDEDLREQSSEYLPRVGRFHATIGRRATLS